MLKYSWIILLVIVFWSSCKPEEEIVANGDKSVRFSADTMLFDTVFSTVGTVTLRMKIYNDQSNAIRIGKIAVGGGANSSFKIIINGQETSSSTNVLLLGKDSLYVLVKVYIDPQNKNLPYLVTDSLIVTSGSNSQLVRLVAWGQDATFLNNAHISGSVVWDNQKPYVVYGKLTIDSNATLTIKDGVNILFGAKAGLTIYGKVQTLGTFEKPVIFNTADLNKQKGVFPGQWEGIGISNSSEGNSLQWTVINNASTGLGIFKNDVNPSSDVSISHCEIKNMTAYGIFSKSGNFNLDNSLVSNCGKNVVRIQSGGRVLWVNNTFVNYSYDFFREGSALYLSDHTNNTNLQNIDFQWVNNIVWGSFTNEITLAANTASGSFLINAENNVLKTNPTAFWGSSNLVFDFAANRRFRNDTIHFVDTYLYNFRPDSISIVREIAKVYPGYTNTNDLDGKSRDNLPDIGAYEYRK